MSTPVPPPDPSSHVPPTASPASGPPRWLRVLAPVGAIAVALGGFAVAQAAIGDSPRDRTEPAPSTTSTSLPDAPSGSVGGPAGPVAAGPVFLANAIPDGTTQTFAAGAAGAVTISRAGTTLTVVSAAANPGWTAVVEAASGPEVEVKFTSPTTRIDLEAEFEDGGVRVRVRERTLVGDPAPGAPAAPRVDNSGPGSVSSGRGSDDSPDVDDDHDSSGRGSDDSPDVDDDHGGSGRGSDDSPDVDDDHGGSSGSSGSRSRGGDDD